MTARIHRIAFVVLLSAASIFLGCAAVSVPPDVLIPPAPLKMQVYKMKPNLPKAVKELRIPPDALQQGSTGDIAFFRPYAEALAPSDRSAVDAATDFFKERLAVGDGVVAVAAEPLILMRQEVNKNETPGGAKEVSAFVRMDRFVEGRRVFGSGSTAIAEVRNGTVEGAIIRWDHATPAGAPLFTRRLTPQLIQQKFAQDFPESIGPAIAVTDSPELVYVSDRQFLEPAYRVMVRLRNPDADAKKVPDDHVVLYVPATDLMPREKESINELVPLDCADEVAEPEPGLPFDMYVLSDSLPFEWATSARRFRRSLTKNAQFVNRRFCRVQPDVLDASKNLYVNSVPISLVETHGSPGFLFTDDDEGVCMEDVGGYGTGGSGRLQLLTLHSCEVVHSRDDDSRWFNAWFRIFAGLHTVVGYRTKALPENVPELFALDVAVSKLPIIRSWIAEVAAHPEYSKGTKVVSSGGLKKPLGRPAAITVCGNNNDEHDRKIEDLADMPDPTCLVNYWLKD